LSPLTQSLIATLLVSATSFVAIVFAFSDLWSERRQMLLLSFATGVLLSTVFLEVFPEAVERAQGDGNIFIATLGAMIGFFFLERFLQGFHAHEESRTVASRYMVVIGNGVHNFIDGVIVAASFIAGPSLGIATTIAVVAHEIPHEIADYAILIRSKLSPRRALLVNFLSGLTALVGVFACFGLRTLVQTHLGWFLTATAGMFIYIAASDLIPELHTHDQRDQWIYTLPFILGVALMAGLGAVARGAH
jgi:zinc and cadmium transporter